MGEEFRGLQVFIWVFMEVFFRSGLEVAHVTSIYIPSSQVAFYAHLQEGLGQVAWLHAQE